MAGTCNSVRCLPTSALSRAEVTGDFCGSLMRQSSKVRSTRRCDCGDYVEDPHKIVIGDLGVFKRVVRVAGRGQGNAPRRSIKQPSKSKHSGLVFGLSKLPSWVQAVWKRLSSPKNYSGWAWSTST